MRSSRALIAGALVTVFAPAAYALDLTAGAGAAQNCAASGLGVAFNAAAVAWLEPAPVVTVSDYGGGRYDPAAGTDRGVAVGYGELTVEAGGFCLGVLYRAQYLAAASKDLLDGLVANHFGRPFDVGRVYRLSMSEDAFRAKGLRLRKVTDIHVARQWSVEVGLAVSVLQGEQGQQQSLSGTLTATSATYAVGDGTWLRTESNLGLSSFNPYVPSGTPHARGFSSDVEALLHSTEGWTMDFAVVDALGRLYWRDVPRSLRTLNNESISYNANFDRDAFVNGIDSRVSFTQDLVPKYHLLLGTPPVKSWSAFAEDDFVGGLHFPSFGARLGTDARSARLAFDVRTHAVGIGASWRFLDASITTDKLRLRDASVLGVSLSARRAW